MIRIEPPNSEDLLYRASSSSTSPHVGDDGGTKRLKEESEYEVFLSFRGEDTRKGFTGHLYTSLVDAGIRVYRDNNELRVGKEIGPELLYSITQSKISIPIISEDYASSKWCLQELAQMLKCRRSEEQVVLPIFYKVKPSQVRDPKGKFGDAINAHKKNLGQEVVKEWEEALNEVSSLKGWESEKIADGHEATLVKTVGIRVMGELKRLFDLSVPEQLVGTYDPVEQIMSKIDANFNGTRIIGIYGMGGIGKTTLAKVLYNKLLSDFEKRSFVANIRETSQRKGIECLQKQLISDVIGESWDMSNVDNGIRVLKSRCKSKKVLALLDDMDDTTHLDALVGDGSWFKVGSIVIITTRNKSILDKVRASHLYELEQLPLNQSLILFSRHAFRNDFPPSDYKHISHDIVSITGGLPLALEVIGSYLCGKTMEVWKDTSKKLKRIPAKEVLERLKISYEALDDGEQQIFLDIACFFIGSSKQNPTYMWDACGFYPGKGIEVLSLMSLIKIDQYGTLMMHDQLRDLGREIVHLEDPKKPRQRSRIWTNEEAEDVLESNKGTCKIEVLRLGCNRWKSYDKKSYKGEQFKEFTDLRFLQMGNVNLTGDFQNLLPQLRWLDWENCPSDFEMVNFDLKKLVVLNLSYSDILKDWGGWGPLKMATELKVLVLFDCALLREIPDSIGKLASLVKLNLSWTSIIKLPESIGNLQNLRSLEFIAALVTELPSAIRMLTKLQVLHAEQCKNLEGLPSSIGEMVSLKELYIDESGISGLPESISELSSLQVLSLWGCENLREIPEPPLSLKTLYVDFPTPSLPYLSKLTLLEELSLFDLRPLECLSELPIQLSKLRINRHRPSLPERDLEKRLSELIRDKSSGLREVTESQRYYDYISYQIYEATNPTIAKSSEEGDPLFDEATSPGTPAVATSSEEGDPLSLSLSAVQISATETGHCKIKRRRRPSLSLARSLVELVKALAEGIRLKFTASRG